MLLLLCSLAFATPLQVGVEHSPPFAIKQGSEWSGISVDLWDKVAAENHWEYELVEQPFDQLLNSADQDTLDVVIPAVTISAAREARMNFSHTYLVEQVAVATSRSNTFFDVALQVGSYLVSPLILLLGVLAVAGVFYFVSEKRREGVRGLFDSCYWALTTMVTVGYGDEAPKSIPGRVFAMFWMFTALFIFASINAKVLGAFTNVTWTPVIDDLSDLRGQQVVTVQGSFSDHLLTSKQVKHATVPTEQEMVNLLKTEAAFAVYDKHILQALTKSEPDIKILPKTFYDQHLGFAVSDQFLHLEELNRTLLTTLDSNWWTSTVFKYTEGE